MVVSGCVRENPLRLPTSEAHVRPRRETDPWGPHVNWMRRGRLRKWKVGRRAVKGKWTERGIPGPFGFWFFFLFFPVLFFFFFSFSNFKFECGSCYESNPCPNVRLRFSSVRIVFVFIYLFLPTKYFISPAFQFLEFLLGFNFPIGVLT
jgi:hypothetical protein